MTRGFDCDLTRCQQAYELHRQGMYYKDIAAKLGVTKTRAQFMADTWEQHLLLLETQAELAEWRKG